MPIIDRRIAKFAFEDVLALRKSLLLCCFQLRSMIESFEFWTLNLKREHELPPVGSCCVSSTVNNIKISAKLEGNVRLLCQELATVNVPALKQLRESQQEHFEAEYQQRRVSLLEQQVLSLFERHFWLQVHNHLQELYLQLWKLRVIWNIN